MSRGGCCLLDLGGGATAKLESGGDASASPGHVQQHVQQAPRDVTPTSSSNQYASKWQMLPE